jgi:membrane protein implicated in regulation of membrane protease activity
MNTGLHRCKTFCPFTRYYAYTTFGDVSTVVSALVKFIAITVDELIFVPLAWVLVYFFAPDLFTAAVIIGIVGSAVFVAIKYYFVFPVLGDSSSHIYDLQDIAGIVIEEVSHRDGKIKVGQEIWDAQCDGAPIPVGTEVRIVSRESMKVRVVPIAEMR